MCALENKLRQIGIASNKKETMEGDMDPVRR